MLACGNTYDDASACGIDEAPDRRVIASLVYAIIASGTISKFREMTIPSLVEAGWLVDVARTSDRVRTDHLLFSYTVFT